MNAYIRQWRRRNLDRVRDIDRRSWRKHRAYYAAYEKRPNVRRKRRIRQVARLAVQLGMIPRRRACERCGISDRAARLHRHHPDYSRPLQVVWLCTLCHGEVHRKRTK